MVIRQGFEHQKDINLEAYTLGLVQRVDINFRIDYKGGVLDSVSQLPVSGNTVNDAFFVRDNINNRVYIWDGAAWVVDQASTGPSGGVNYTTAPTTTGNRIVQSIGVNADLIEETLIEVDPMTGDILFPSTINVDIANLNVTNLTISGGNVIVNVATDKDNQTYNGTDPTRVLPSTPLSEDALHITTSSGTNLILGVDYSVSGDTITWILAPTNGEGLYAWWLVSTGLVAPGSMYKKTYSWAAGAGDSSVTFADVDIASDSIITGWTITSGTQLGFREFDLSTPGQITINSTATETGTIDFTYAYVI